MIGDLTSEDAAAWAAKRTASEAAAAFEQVGGRAIPVQLGSTLLQDPSLAAAEVFQRSPSDDLVKGFPFQLRRSPMRVSLDAPTVGRDDALYL